MAKLSFEIKQDEAPQPLLPGWLKVVLYFSLLGVCGVLMATALNAP
jgi:hypothetical protein